MGGLPTRSQMVFGERPSSAMDGLTGMTPESREVEIVAARAYWKAAFLAGGLEGPVGRSQCRGVRLMDPARRRGPLHGPAAAPFPRGVPPRTALPTVSCRIYP